MGAVDTPTLQPQRQARNDGWDYVAPHTGTNTITILGGQMGDKRGHAGQKGDKFPDIQLEIGDDAGIEVGDTPVELGDAYNFEERIAAGHRAASEDKKRYAQTAMLHAMSIGELAALPTDELKRYLSTVKENRKKSRQRAGDGGGSKALYWAQRANEIDKILSSRILSSRK